jgi:threonine/homoserine/homoserine lactone efflux protein
MLTAIGQGIVFGIVLCFSIGPAFFGLIQTSLKHGYGNGIAMALGIFASDLTYLLIANSTISSWLMDDRYKIPVGVCGGVLLIGYGLVQSFKKTVIQNVDGGVIEFKKPTYSSSTLKGFIMNLLNPFVLFLWIAAVALAAKNLENDRWHIFLFFVATLAVVLGTDILKALASHKIKSYLNVTMIHKVNVLAGIILVISGIILILRVFLENPVVKK